MGRLIEAADVEAEVATLLDLGTAALRERWRRLTGHEPAPGLKGELLRAALAHKLQERAFGALSRDAAKRLAAMAQALGAEAKGEATPSASAGRRIKPGSRILREWQGHTHEIVVVQDGYLWSGEVHASLSAIARAITGTSWSGWRFFGLDPRKQRRGRGQRRQSCHDRRAFLAVAQASPRSRRMTSASGYMPRYRKVGAVGANAHGSAGVSGSGPAVRRCAIYTRKSTEEGLAQDFNSLDAQREACEAYVLSQRHEGWRLLPQGYDDGGYSGGTMARPGLQALLASVDAGEVDVVVVYKVDRLTRSLADFAKIVERFDRRGVSFVSVTQAFNTTSSMGRLTLNVLLSFAQFEREVGAERVRDKVAASRRKGMWMGGTVPLGYRVENKKLMVEPGEAKTVRTIFELYLELGSTPALLAELRRRGITTAIRTASTGRVVGGIPFGPGSISYLLHNRIYVGEVEHRGEIHKGEHEPILDHSLFDAVQQRLAANAHDKRLRAQSQAILTGLIFDSRGNRMSPTHANKAGVRYRYYVTRASPRGGPRRRAT
jgi:DNA invertase Pin-like site-specific DNA recombinase